MGLRGAPLPQRKRPLDFLKTGEALDYVLPRIREAAEPGYPGSYVRVGEWGARWSPWGDARWFETTHKLQGLVNDLPKGVVGKYHLGHLDDNRRIGRVSVAETIIAYEVPNRDGLTLLGIAALGVIRYLDGYDTVDDSIIRQVEVPVAMAEDQKRHDQMVHHLLYGNWQE